MFEDLKNGSWSIWRFQTKSLHVGWMFLCQISKDDMKAEENGQSSRPNKTPYERKKLLRMKRQSANQVNNRHAWIILLSALEALCDCSLSAEFNL